MEETKKGKKKTIIIIVIALLIIGALAGLYFWDKANTITLEKSLKTPALDYFDKYMSANTGASAYKVTLADLEKANNNGEDYNLKVLSKCEKTSTYATINIDYFNGKITDTKIKLDCKKF